MVTTKLFDGPATTAQKLVVSAWYLNLGLVLAVWATTSTDLLSSGNLGNVILVFGRLFGLLAATFALTQFMLMGRIAWIEKPFGLDHLASYHRFNGYAAISFILIHAPFVILGYSLTAHTNYIAQYKDVLLHYQYVIPAAIAVVLFLTVVATSIYIVRKHLKFESWYYVHLVTYAAIVLALFHQLAIGGSFLGHPLARLYWIAVYIFVATNVLIWRFTLPTVNLLRFKFKVGRVVAETPTTTSIYIRGKNLDRWPAQPGQYVLVRFLGRGFITQEHPFSISQMPAKDEFRLTIRNSGDYTSHISSLKPGTKALVSGPYGRFTSTVAKTEKRLFIAGGVGITPLRTMLQEALAQKKDCVLVYANRSVDDIIFKKELAEYIARGLRLIPVFSEPPSGYKGERGYVDSKLLSRVVKDISQRDVYICGPQPMMDSVIAGLRATKLPPDQLHFERFALHN